MYAYLPGGTLRALADIPGGDLSPMSVPKYQTPLLVPPVMPRAGVLPNPGGKPVDYYEISMRQFAQQVLPAGLPATTVWGYGAVASKSKRGLLIHHAPSLTVEAEWGRPVRVKWINDLRGRARELPAAPAAGGPDAALGEPTGRAGGSRRAADVRRDAGALHRPGARW